MNQEKIGKFIAQCRKEKNLTQSQLAEKLNMSNKSISKWETGKGMPDSSIMLELCTYLGINVNELLSGEHLEKEQYQEKANENIINIAKESDKNKKIKNKIIVAIAIVAICLLIYDNRLIKAKIEEDSIICSFNGSSLVTLYYQTFNTNSETLIFVNGKMLLQNKIHSHFETWDSMAQLNNEENLNFNSELIINKSKDIPNCKEKIKVYYTNISFNKIEEANQDELQSIIENSDLMVES